MAKIRASSRGLEGSRYLTASLKFAKIDPCCHGNEILEILTQT